MIAANTSLDAACNLNFGIMRAAALPTGPGFVPVTAILRSGVAGACLRHPHDLR